MHVYSVSNCSVPLNNKSGPAALDRAALNFQLHKVLEEHQAKPSHWHFKRASVTGTLEVTWEHTTNTILVIVHKNRLGADGWALNQAPLFAKALAAILGGEVSPQHATNRH